MLMSMLRSRSQTTPMLKLRGWRRCNLNKLINQEIKKSHGEVLVATVNSARRSSALGRRRWGLVGKLAEMLQ